MNLAVSARRVGGAAVVALAFGAPAWAQTNSFSWTRPANWGYNAGSTEGVMDAGGVFESLGSTYNPTSHRLTFQMTLSATTANYTTSRPAPPKLTEGFTLMMNNGPAFGNPSSPSDPQKRGILAQLFMEGYNPAVDGPNSTAAAWNGVPYQGRLSAYAWNGKRIFGHPWRNEDSYADGYADPTENTSSTATPFYDPPNRLMTSVNGGIGSSAFRTVTVTSSVTAQTVSPGVQRDKYTRTFAFDFDTTLIKNFVPPQSIAQPGMAWYGIGFGDGTGGMAPPNQLGIWMRTYKYVRDTVPSPDSDTPLLPDFTGATLAGADYWDAGEATQFGPLGAGDSRIGFLRDYEPLAGGGVDRLGWETAGPMDDASPYTNTVNVGFFDLFGLTTTVPAPGTICGPAMALALVARRRR